MKATKVAQLRKVLAASAVIHDKGGQSDVARSLQQLVDALKPADKSTVPQLIKRLSHK